MTDSQQSADLARLAKAVDWDTIQHAVFLADQEYGSDPACDAASEALSKFVDALALIDGSDDG